MIALPRYSVLLLFACAGCRNTDASDSAAPADLRQPAAATQPSLHESRDNSQAQVVGSKHAGFLKSTEVARLAHFTMSLGAVKTCSIEPYLKPKPGSIVLGVQVTIQGTTAMDVPANPFYATLESTSGEHYEATLAGCRPALQSTRVRNEDSAKGFISFVVPDGESAWKLRYNPAIIGFPNEEARFNLEE